MKTLAELMGELEMSLKTADAREADIRQGICKEICIGIKQGKYWPSELFSLPDTEAKAYFLYMICYFTRLPVSI